MLDRIKNWKTSVAGTAMGGILLYVVHAAMQQARCNFDNISWAAIAAGVGPMILGILSHDKPA